MPRYQLFFANKRVDQPVVDSIKELIVKHHPNFKFDDLSSNVPHADDWKIAAGEMLSRCDALICLVGAETHTSGPVDWEIREAHKLQKPVLAATLDENFKTPLCCSELDVSIVSGKKKHLASHIVKLLLPQILFAHYTWGDGKPESDVIEKQYHIIVQSWEALIARRQAVNSIYLTALAALLAGVGVFIGSVDKTGWLRSSAGAMLFAFVGLVLAIIWWHTIISYGILSTAKASVVTAFEKYLPAKVFDAEWQVLESKRYKRTTTADAVTAVVFMVLFLFVGTFAGVIAVNKRLSDDVPSGSATSESVSSGISAGIGP